MVVFVFANIVGVSTVLVAVFVLLTFVRPPSLELDPPPPIQICAVTGPVNGPRTWVCNDIDIHDLMIWVSETTSPRPMMKRQFCANVIVDNVSKFWTLWTIF